MAKKSGMKGKAPNDSIKKKKMPAGDAGFITKRILEHVNKNDSIK